MRVSFRDVEGNLHLVDAAEVTFDLETHAFIIELAATVESTLWIKSVTHTNDTFATRWISNEVFIEYDSIALYTKIKTMLSEFLVAGFADLSAFEFDKELLYMAKDGCFYP